jgi:hypothetical protein
MCLRGAFFGISLYRHSLILSEELFVLTSAALERQEPYQARSTEDPELVYQRCLMLSRHRDI